MLEFLLPAFVACLVLTGIHCYLGMHVLQRQVIFVDLALAQIAALGVALGALVGVLPHTDASYLVSLAFTLLGAAVFALGRFRDGRVPQEAVIGIVYAVSTALMFLVLSRSALDRDEVEHMMIGRLLFVLWPEILVTVVIYSAVAALHWILRERFFAISRGDVAGMSRGALRWWDFVFYATFGIVVSKSVQMAGVLLVFSFLVVPAACAAFFWDSNRARLLGGWSFGVLGSVLGVYISAAFDFPTGASVVAAFGVLFVLSATVAGWRAHHATAMHAASGVPGPALGTQKPR